MPHLVEYPEKNKAKITVTVPFEVVEQGMHHAAEHLAEEAKVPGFRPGKADYETIAQRFGEMKILEAATEELIRDSFVAAMIEEDLETVGQPYFAVVKMVPGDDFIYSAEVALMPHVKKLADYKKLSVKKESTEPTPEVIAEAKRDLSRMQTKELRAPAGHTITLGDKAVINLTMKKDNVVVEGGESKNHGVYTAEPHYIPGFADAIVGLKEGDNKTFTLPFPSEHYQKHLAGQNVDFLVTVNEIFMLEAPAFDDEFAKKLGLGSVTELEQKLIDNLREERVTQEAKKMDKEVLELLAQKSDFDEIPDLLVNQEVEKMIDELRYNVEDQGATLEEYLGSVKKSLTDLKLDFAATGLTRVKVALVLKEVMKTEGIKPTQDAIDAELDKIASQFPEGHENRKRVYEDDYRDYVERQVTNRKTIDFLKEQMVR